MVGGILSGIGEGLVARRERRDQMRNAAYQSGIQALTQISNNPNFSNDPEAVKDITSTAMQMSRVLTGQTDQVPGKGGKMQKQDPWAFVESRLNNAVSQHYGGQPAQERPAPAELPGGIPLPGSDAAAGRTATVPAVKPHRMILTPEEKQQLQIKQQQIEFDEKQRQEEQAAASAKRRKAIDDQTYHERRMAEGKQIGLTGIQLAEYSDPEKRTLTAEARPVAKQRVSLVDPDGKVFIGEQDPQTMRVYKITGEELDGNKYHIQTPEERSAEKRGVEKSLSEEELTARSLEGDTKAQAILDAMQERKRKIALASKQTPTQTMEQQGIEVVAQSLAHGDLTALRDVTSMMGGNRLMVYARTKSINPNFSVAETQRKIDMYKLYTTGKMGENLQSFGTFLEHAGELSDAVQNIRLLSAPLANRPLNWLRKNAQGSGELAALETALEPVRKEYEAFLLGNRAMHDDDRKAINLILSDTASPAQIQGALKQMGKTARDRFTEANFRFKKVMKQDIEDPFSPDAIEGAKKVGVELKGGSETGEPVPEIKATDRAAYDALPSGSKYTTNGIAYVKK
jgi:hypothetical protein